MDHAEQRESRRRSPSSVWFLPPRLMASVAAYASDNPPGALRNPGDRPAETRARQPPGPEFGGRIAVGPYPAIRWSWDWGRTSGDANEPSTRPIPPVEQHRWWRQFDNVSPTSVGGHGHSFDGGHIGFPGLTPGVRSDPVVDADSTGASTAQPAERLRHGHVSSRWTRREQGAPVPAFGGGKIGWRKGARGIGGGNVYGMCVSGSCCGSRIFTRSTDGAESFEGRSA
jgi:hypothetical protein